MNATLGLKNKLSDNGFKIRIYSEDRCECHVGLSVSDNNIDNVFGTITLPASEYAVFEVFVSKGYDSENQAMERWLSENSKIYKQAQINGKSFVVEYYSDGDFSEIYLTDYSFDQQNGITLFHVFYNFLSIINNV